jgi:hypothetical protein
MLLPNEYFSFPEQKNPARKMQLAAVDHLLVMRILQRFPERLFS